MESTLTIRINNLDAVNGPAATPSSATLPEVQTFFTSLMSEAVDSLSQPFAKHRSLCRRNRYCPVDVIFQVFSADLFLCVKYRSCSRADDLDAENPHPVKRRCKMMKVIHFDPNMKRHGSVFREYPIPDSLHHLRKIRWK